MHIDCIMMNPEYAFWALCGRGIQDQADEHGITLSIRPVENNDEAQVEFLDCLRQPTCGCADHCRMHLLPPRTWRYGWCPANPGD